MKAEESLRRRYLQTLGVMMDQDKPDRHWMPMVSIGAASATFIDAAYHAAAKVDRDVIILELFADERKVVQHRIQAAYRAGGKLRQVHDCMLWVPDSASRALIVPSAGSSRFRLEVDADGRLRHHADLPAVDITFGAALAARRLREIARGIMPDADMSVLNLKSR